MVVREVVSESPATCQKGTSLQEAARMMLECDCGALPVTDDEGHPTGIITDRNIIVRIVAKGINPLEKSVGDAMTDEVISIHPDNSLDHAVLLMERYQIRRIVVVDNGVCVGMLSQADIARKAPETLTGKLVEDISRPGR